MGWLLHLRNKRIWTILLCSVFLGLFYFFGKSRLALSDTQKAVKIQRLYRGYQFSGFRHINDLAPREVFELRKQEDLVFVDVRQAKERAVAIIEGAISQEEFEKSPTKFKDKKVIVYCTIGNRSGRWARAWGSRGFEVYNLKGGVLSWAHAGGDFFREGHRVRQVHVYDAGWNFLPHEFEAVW